MATLLLDPTEVARAGIRLVQAAIRVCKAIRHLREEEGTVEGDEDAAIDC
jgi:hypothetical protein